jgi:ketol-acid reductoisomerase
MKGILKEIQQGEFAREWILENRANRPVFRALVAQDENHPIEEVGKRLRGMMSWVKSNVQQQVEEAQSEAVAQRMRNLEVRE